MQVLNFFMDNNAGSPATQVALNVLEDAVDINGKHLMCCVFSLLLVCCYCKATQLSKCIPNVYFQVQEGCFMYPEQNSNVALGS